MIMLNNELTAVTCTTSSSDKDCLQNACFIFGELLHLTLFKCL